jgi:thiol-disulfide isomerase/thioredoxin
MKPLNISSRLPKIENLRGVDGKKYGSEAYQDSPFLLVIFSCNHCPYVRAYEDRIINFVKEYKDKGLAVLYINSNEDKNYPEDSFDEMVKRAKEKNFPFPYVRDEDQSVARAFGATHTPEFFLFDKERKLRYHGRFDDNWREPENVQRHYLQEAIDALLDGNEVAEPEVHSIGCTIKWRY